MDAQTHDEAVATISHLPQVAASLVAAQLRSLDEQALGLAGQGVRDVTRIAASDPRLWTQIIAGNAGSIREVLGRVHADLGELLDALAALADPDDAVGSLEVVNRTITHGNVGHARIPGCLLYTSMCIRDSSTLVIVARFLALLELYKDCLLYTSRCV